MCRKIKMFFIILIADFLEGVDDLIYFISRGKKITFYGINYYNKKTTPKRIVL